MTARQFSDDCLTNDFLTSAKQLPHTAWRQPDNCLTTAWQLPDNCLTTAWQPPNNCLTTAWQLPDTAWQLPDTAWQLPDNWLTTAWQLPDNCLTTIGTSKLYDYKNRKRTRLLEKNIRLSTTAHSLKTNLQKRGMTYLNGLNRSSRRKKGMAFNPLFIIPDTFIAFSQWTLLWLP